MKKKKEHNDESVLFTQTGTDDGEEKVARVTYVNKTLHSIFSNVEVYINNQQVYNSSGLYAHKSYILRNFKGAITEYKGFFIVKAMIMNRILKILLTPYLIPFLRGE